MTRAEREKQHEREVVVSRLKLALIALCLVAIPVSFLWNHIDIGGVGARITKVESPCLRYGPDSKICEHAFEEAAASINHRMACYFQHRAGVHPPSCRGVHLRIKPDRPPSRVEGSSDSGTQSGGDASTPTKVHSQPGPHVGGPGTDQPSHPHAPSVPHQSPPSESGSGNKEASPPAATEESSTTPSQAPSSTAERSMVESAPAPVPEAVGGVIEGVGKTVEGTGAAVTGTVEGVTETTCSLAKVLCP